VFTEGTSCILIALTLWASFVGSGRFRVGGATLTTRPTGCNAVYKKHRRHALGRGTARRCEVL